MNSSLDETKINEVKTQLGDLVLWSTSQRSSLLQLLG